MAGNVSNLKPFVKGDPRINRKGRPKSFDALRALAVAIAHEPVVVDGGPVVVDGHAVTVAENILRRWALSGDTTSEARFVETAFGKIPNELQLSGANVRVDVTTLSDEELRAIVDA